MNAMRKLKGLGLDPLFFACLLVSFVFNNNPASPLLACTSNILRYFTSNFTNSYWNTVHPGGSLAYKVVRMLAIKNGVKGSIFSLVGSSKFLENRVLFRLSFNV